ncbi:DUF916 domain-containing protein [uncultured Weissella sp.]|uniref:DUF916 domain-containing protein n=1 Tax=uncultured Weissella sp. TaxID=253243 RepID=UPI0025832372|nr:DUF916 domain-containing protein [uncultured Weissella sp.]
MKIKTIALVGSAIVATLFGGISAHAAGNDYSVQAVVPASQIDKSNASYFDFKLNGGQSETLTFNLQNTSDKTITVDVSKGTAKTADSGSIDYASDGPFDGSMPDQLGKYLETPNKVTLAPKQTQAVVVKFTMPTIPVSGVLAGGVRFTEEGQDDQQSSGSGMKLNSIVSYTIAVLARNKTENNDIADTLNTGKVEPKTVNAATNILAEVSNPKQALLNRLEITGKVTDPDGRIAFKGTQKMMQMAPNSKFNFSLPTKGGELQAGKYTAKYTAFWSEDVNGKFADAAGTRFDYRKDWTETFTLSDSQAKKFNADDTLVKAKHSMPVIMWVIIGVVVLLVLVIVGLIWFILAKRRKEEREENMDKLK